MLLLTTMCSEKQLGVAIFFPLQQKNETNSFLELQTTSQNIQEIKEKTIFFHFTKNRSVKFEFDVLVLRLSVNYATFLGN